VDQTEGAPEEPVPIPNIALEQLTTQNRDYLSLATPFTHVWTDDWSPLFYRTQARLGFIAVASRGPNESNVLIPELQRLYAVLDWANLRIDRGVRKIMESGRLTGDIHLEIDGDPERVLDLLTQTWGEKTWLVPEYVRLMRTLATDRERAADPGFRVLATLLSVGSEPVAGELGYAVGRGYVSLSGFFRRENPDWNHLGKLQLVLLAQRLESAGFAFWNLGHPYMDYKTRLGAKSLSRDEFLPRWDEATDGEVPEIDP
jgi:hypothetical protein